MPSKICPYMPNQAWSSPIRGVWVYGGYLIHVCTLSPLRTL